MRRSFFAKFFIKMDNFRRLAVSVFIMGLQSDKERYAYVWQPP
ncbi:hypothetical protein FBY09_109122 [Pseudomonas sp. SJZ101]|nr:hypothetical protein FBY00_109122 [Pseudomonas sp. SJZ075]TWC33798.1 hypothetical protein FBY02_10864 [Pseudomonas sp. SJZ078]TWC54750.1 hypothetical protein FBY11_10964 [Pseudomonas sp. SJZ124]TWC88688.1 hypothetical protein FBY09_109122 [Pseudomonas sp. SJZ101]